MRSNKSSDRTFRNLDDETSILKMVLRDKLFIENNLEELLGCQSCSVLWLNNEGELVEHFLLDNERSLFIPDINNKIPFSFLFNDEIAEPIIEKLYDYLITSESETFRITPENEENTIVKGKFLRRDLNFYIFIIASIKKGKECLDQESFKVLFENMINGFAQFEIIDHETNRIGLSSHNKAFTQILGLDNISPHTSIDNLFPFLDKSLLINFSNVLITKKTIDFDGYNAGFGKHLKFHLFPISSNRIGVLISDVSDSVSHHKKLQRVQFAINNFIDECYFYDKSGSIVFVNEAAIIRSGYAYEELVGKKFYDIIEGLDSSSFCEAWESILEMGYLEYETTKKMKSGAGYEVSIICQLLNLDEETLVFAIVHDITQRKIEESIVRDSEERFRVVFEDSPLGIVIFDHQMNVTAYNESAYSALGFDAGNKESIIGKNIFRLNAIAKSIESNSNVNSNFKFEYELILKKQMGRLPNIGNSSKRYFKATFSPYGLKENSDAPLGYVLNINDITVEKQSDKLLNESRQYLEEAQKIAKLGYWNYNFKVKQFSASNEVYKLFEIQPKSDIAFKGLLKKIIHIDDYEMVKFKIDSVLRNTIKETDSFEFRIVISGKVKYLHAIIIRNNDNQHTEIFGIIQDITDRKILEIQYLESKEKAEESDRLKSAFLANMSHEIRTPMNAIIGFSNLLQDEDFSTEQKNEFIRHINTNSDHLLSIINDILDISKIETGQMTVALHNTSINELINQLYSNFKLQISASHIEMSIKLSLPNNEAILKTDEQKLKQILINLISNAIKFTAIGEIEFGYTIIPNYYEFFVRDTGIGIPKSSINYIFERFRQVNDAYLLKINKGGTGLGLSIAKAFVNMLGGNISVHSEEGVGTIFKFTIPIDEQTVGHSLIKDEKLRVLKEKFSSKKILIIDDEELDQIVLREHLSITNVNVIEAFSGEEGVEKMTNDSTIGLVILDLMLPGIDGFETITRIKAIRPQVPVIIYTAQALVSEREKALNLGCSDYLIKPINKFDLLEKLEKYLD